MAPKAVLFDFDGVLVDSENHHIAGWQRALGTLGWNVTEPAAARAAVLDDHEFVSRTFADRDMPMADLNAWIARKQAITRMLLRDAPRLYPGVRELVNRLSGKVRMAVVTTTWRENVEAALEGAGLLDRFETIVAKEDVEKLKPDPEPYQVALRRLRLRTAAVALEDSPSGLASAHAAGLRAIAVGHRLPPGEWSVSAPYIAGFEPLDAILELLEI